MANRAAPDKSANDFFAVEIPRDVAHGPMRMKFMLVKTADSGCFLTAMLKSM
jgi:hypothetical protein